MYTVADHLFYSFGRNHVNGFRGLNGLQPVMMPLPVGLLRTSTLIGGSLLNFPKIRYRQHHHLGCLWNADCVVGVEDTCMCSKVHL